jgi:hypothetical protein
MRTTQSEVSAQFVNCDYRRAHFRRWGTSLAVLRFQLAAGDIDGGNIRTSTQESTTSSRSFQGLDGLNETGLVTLLHQRAVRFPGSNTWQKLSGASGRRCRAARSAGKGRQPGQQRDSRPTTIGRGYLAHDFEGKYKLANLQEVKTAFRKYANAAGTRGFQGLQSILQTFETVQGRWSRSRR